MDYPTTDDLHNGKFTDGDPIAGIAPSVDSAEHMNALYDELINVIEGAELTPDVANKTQLLEAINYYRNASNMVEGTVPVERLPNNLLHHSDLTGSVHYFAMPVAPDGFIKANGAEVSRTAYADLFAKIGTTFGDGDGSTTFNVPDLRGEFIRGWDDGRGTDTDREFGSWQEDAIRNIVASSRFASDGNGSNGVGPLSATGAMFGSGNPSARIGDVNGSRAGSVVLEFDASRVVPTADENRPRNIALLACIKY